MPTPQDVPAPDDQHRATTRRRPGGARALARAAVMADLLATAREHLERDGATGLSLRSVARDLGMVSSAVYRYVDSRDALLTLLIVAGYDEVGEVVEDAARAARADGAGPADTWLAVARAFRAWALDNRATFELLYGTPVRGYTAPQDTIRPATRLWGVIAVVLLDALSHGGLGPTAPPVRAEGLVTDKIYEFAGYPDPTTAPPEVTSAIARSGALFAALVGGVGGELFGHFHGFTHDPARAFDIAIQTASAGIGLLIDLADAPDGGATDTR